MQDTTGGGFTLEVVKITFKYENIHKQDATLFQCVSLMKQASAFTYIPFRL